MNCRRAQTDIALWAGNDLSEIDCQSLQRHLEVCPKCRDYKAHMQAIMQVVDECPLRDEADEASKSAVAEGLWPSLASRLVSLPTPRNDRFNGWIPAIAVAAVCLAMLMVASPQDAFPPTSSAVPNETDPADTEWSHETNASASNLEAASDPQSAPQRFVRPPIPGMRVDERRTRPFGFSERNENHATSSHANRPRNFGGVLEDEFPGFERRNSPFPPAPDTLRSHWQPPRMMFSIEP